MLEGGDGFRRSLTSLGFVFFGSCENAPNLEVW